MVRDWAKKTKDGSPGITVRQQSQELRCIAGELLLRFPQLQSLTNMQERLFSFLAGALPVGKISPDHLQHCREWLEKEGFATQARNWRWSSVYRRPYQQITRQSLQLFLEGKGYDTASAYFWAVAASVHTGFLHAGSAPVPCHPNRMQLRFEQERQAFLQELWQNCGQPQLPVLTRADTSLWLIAGFLTLTMQLNTEFFPPDGMLSTKEMQLQAAMAVKISGIGLPQVVKELSYRDLFGTSASSSMPQACITAMQEPGAYVVEAPAGMNKTEGALCAAYTLLRQGKADGVYLGMSSQTAANRMLRVMKEYASRICPDAPAAQLVHSNAWFYEDTSVSDSETPDTRALWQTSTLEALLAPFGVGTIDQALMAVLAVRHFPLRRLALSGKVVILDEVHSYDIYTGSLVACLRKELEELGCTVIILSSTLNENFRCELLQEPDSHVDNAHAPYPRISGHTREMTIPQYTLPAPPDANIHVLHRDMDAALALAVREAKNGRHVLWVCDTVRSCQRTFSRLKEDAGDVTLGLLHAQFPLFMREKIEDTWIQLFSADNDSHGAILVATQIVEQKIPLAVDALISELAPTDILLQRMTHLYRFPRKNPLFCLLEETEDIRTLRRLQAREIRQVLGSKTLVYHPYALLRALEQWTAISRVALPSDIRVLMADVYADRSGPEAWNTLADEHWLAEKAARMLANRKSDIWNPAVQYSRYLDTYNSERTDYSFVMCTEESETSLTLLENDAKIVFQNGKASPETARILHRNAVRITDWNFRERPRDKRLTPYFLNGRILLGPLGPDIPLLRQGRTISWDDELGLILK